MPCHPSQNDENEKHGYQIYKVADGQSSAVNQYCQSPGHNKGVIVQQAPFVPSLGPIAIRARAPGSTLPRRLQEACISIGHTT